VIEGLYTISGQVLSSHSIVSSSRTVRQSDAVQSMRTVA